MDGWKFAYSVDDPRKSAGAGASQESSALNIRQMDLKGKSSADDTSLKTIHQNSITTLRPYEGT